MQRAAAGYALRYADGDGTELPRDQWVPARTDTIFDLASVSKLFTSIALVQQVEAGRIDLDRTVASYIPAFAANGKDAVTVRQLLTHTSGFPAWLPLWSSQPTPEARIQAVYDAKLANPPGSTYLYSDLNMITAGKLVELVTGKPLDQVVHDRHHRSAEDARHRVQPAGVRARPDRRDGVPDRAAARHGARQRARRERLVAERGGRPRRGLLHGRRPGGAGADHHQRRVVRQPAHPQRNSVDALLHNENEEFPGNSHGLGFELDQRWYMDGLSSPETAGHTGYTGTSIVIDRRVESFVILLTNRVHPSRNWGSNNPARRAVARDMALALPVRAAEGRTAWFSGVGDARTATLSVPVQLGARRPG